MARRSNSSVDGMPSVLIVDDDRLFAEAARMVLSEGGVSRIAVESDPHRGLRAALEVKPDAILIELDQENEAGLKVCMQMLATRIPSKVIAFTGNPDGAAVARAARAGISGVISKSSPPEDLLPTVMRVLEGEIDLPAGRESYIDGESGDVLASMLKTKLTKREKEMLALLMEGRSSREIAMSLALTQNTVRTHIQSLLKKLHVHSRVEAAAFAAKHELV
jgi:two-component system nitrate/nitrite response regulator NarL